MNEYDFQIINDKLDDSLLALEKILFGDNPPLPVDTTNQNE